MDEVDELIEMIDNKMSSGVSRLSVGFSEDLQTGVKRELYHHGRCDVGSPWAKGTISNCDVTDRTEDT
ncbi:MAG: hypothetical protein IKH46_08135 [Lachnospiraceae bacterium]|jgi:hypothetical protein|nr:hypothetical protein [Lachnospiraceae bacterium]MBR3735407.1 hypothetical protein [Lachnospiraceae bacterium]MBR6849167.1 hypothetical protein [Lachnospiraceae bacterium]